MSDLSSKRPSKSAKSGSAAMDALRRRLNQLGVTTGQNFTPRPPKPVHGIETLVNGTIAETEHGPSFRVVRIYPAETMHGRSALAGWLTQNPQTLERIGADPKLGKIAPNRFVFLDTETTGLGSGTANFAFIVGIGFFNANQDFEVHQFFLRDPAEEQAMLHIIHEMIWTDGALVTFNGRSFDVPLLADRYIMSRMRTHVNRLPNLDLLAPSRRLWKRRLESCRLGALEVDILGLSRTHSDVPGSIIPYLYRQYLKTGDGTEMLRVLYHNEQDVLSMVALANVLCESFDQANTSEMPLDDRLSLARWYQQRGMLAESEAAYRLLLDECEDEQRRYDALVGLASMLKRSGRHIEAIPLWEYVADLKIDILGHEELAKYYEWQGADLPNALAWTEAGIALAESWRPGLRRTEAARTLEARRARLVRKIASRQGVE